VHHSHVEKKGMSVLRENASNGEFEAIIRARIKDAAKQSLRAIATASCSRIRELVASQNSEKRRRSDRFYCVLDTDMAGLPNHADIFATVPRPHATLTDKTIWRRERAKLLGLFLEDVSDPRTFRAGALNG
jgi:hypothetical protein